MKNKSENKKVGIFTTNEDNVFVVYPYDITTIMEDEHELFVEAEIFLGPNETSTSDELRLLLVIPTTRDWYEIAIKVIDRYKEKLEGELSQMVTNQKTVIINPQ